MNLVAIKSTTNDEEQNFFDFEVRYLDSDVKTTVEELAGNACATLVTNVASF